MDGMIVFVIPVLLFIAIFSFAKHFFGQRSKTLKISRRRR
jgi:hypothetical protein